MRVLIACEESQTICKAMRKLGHEAYSCDILPCSGGHPEWHIKSDVLRVLNLGTFRLENGDILNVLGWDLMIAHPPCTYLSNAGSGGFNEEKYGDKARERKRKRFEAYDFVMALANANIPKIAIENPTGWLNSHWRKPDQIIQPWQFGDEESKRTCLWLKNLPLLQHTKIVKPKVYAYYKKGKKKGMPIYGNSYLKFSEDRGKIRSKTFPGIAKAISEQWTNKEVAGCNADCHDGIPPKTKVLGILPKIL